jgi:hypothetical protein
VESKNIEPIEVERRCMVTESCVKGWGVLVKGYKILGRTILRGFVQSSDYN